MMVAEFKLFYFINVSFLHCSLLLAILLSSVDAKFLLVENKNSKYWNT